MSGEDLKFNVTVRQLKGKQSVRTTFKLKEETVKLLADVATLLRVKQKSLLDELLEDEKTLEQIAAKANFGNSGEERRQKTFVVSRNSYETLKKVSCKANIHRDYLVEASILRLAPILVAEEEKHSLRKKLFNELLSFCEQGKKLYRLSKKNLGNDDSATLSLKRVVQTCEDSVLELNKIILQGHQHR